MQNDFFDLMLKNGGHNKAPVNSENATQEAFNALSGKVDKKVNEIAEKKLTQFEAKINKALDKRIKELIEADTQREKEINERLNERVVSLVQSSITQYMDSLPIYESMAAANEAGHVGLFILGNGIVAFAKTNRF